MPPPTRIAGRSQPAGAPAAPGPVPIAIFGSRATRDAFGPAPRDIGYEIVAEIGGSPVIGAVAGRAATGAADALGRLEASGPAYVVIDLIEERHPVVLLPGGALATRPAGAGTPGQADPPGVAVDVETAAGQDFWRRCAAAFAGRLRRIVPENRVLIHRAFWSDRVAGPAGDGPADAATQAQARRANARLNAAYDALQSELPRARLIRVPAALRVADPGHAGGPAPFHYTAAYHRALLHRLHAIVTEDRAPGDGRHRPWQSVQLPAWTQERLARAAFDPVALYDAATAWTGPAVPPDVALELSATVVTTMGPPGADRPLEALEAATLASGPAEAVYQVGLARARGILLAQDDAKALRAFMLAALLGHAPAIRDVAEAFDAGRGTRRDPARAAAWRALLPG